MSKLIGKPSVNPLLFYTGKVSGYIAVLSIPVQLFFNLRMVESNLLFNLASMFFLILGIFFTFVSILNLGDAISLGIPKEKTQFKSGGLYKFSRNPMYIGFHCISISAIFFTLNAFIGILVLYSTLVYHRIIKGEEIYLQNKFGDKYTNYLKSVRRYI